MQLTVNRLHTLIKQHRRSEHLASKNRGASANRLSVQSPTLVHYLGEQSVGGI